MAEAESNIPPPSPSRSIIEDEPTKNEDLNSQLEKAVGLDISTLPKKRGWVLSHLYLYRGFWSHHPILQGIIIARNQTYNQLIDKPQTGILLATMPKAGTTWIKALLFALTTRSQNSDYSTTSHPLFTCTPHQLVPFIESYARNNPLNPIPPESFTHLATHIPYDSLPESIKRSRCRIVYLCRNPKDVLVSLWHYSNKATSQAPLSLEEAVHLFCEGASAYGPFWDHVLGYWQASTDMPEKVLFMKYEDLKANTPDQLRRLSEFVGLPFSAEEETQGVVQKIVDLCSFEKLSNMEINKSQVSTSTALTLKFSNNVYFRKGEVGDYQNHLTKEMAERIDRVIKEKLGGSGLTFND